MEGIELNELTRSFLHYIAHEGAQGYIESALLGYQLLVHEFGSDIKVIFTMNFHDYCSPMLKLRMENMPEDAMDRINKIQKTIHTLRYGTGQENVIITIR